MAASNIVKRKRRGDYCVAGGPNKVSCKNSSYSEGISMHCFPKDEIVRKKWTNFVQKHRKNFVPSNKSCLCSAHFDENCYENRPVPFVDLPNMEQPPRFKRYLIKGSVPTNDVAGRTPEMPKTPSARQRRQVSTLMFLIFILLFIKLYEALKHVCGVKASRKFSKGSLSYINDM